MSYYCKFDIITRFNVPNKARSTRFNTQTGIHEKNAWKESAVTEQVCELADAAFLWALADFNLGEKISVHINQESRDIVVRKD